MLPGGGTHPIWRGMELMIDPAGVATWRGRRYPCTLGRSGILADKAEGDGATPAGRFSLLRVLYRSDRVQRPVTGLPVAAIGRDAGWCDAPGDRQYNRQVVLPYGASCEALWRDDHVYDLVVVTSHNTDPTIDGTGSAVFVHLMRDDGGATEGCIAFDRTDLLEILSEWSDGDRLVIPAP